MLEVYYALGVAPGGRSCSVCQGISHNKQYGKTTMETVNMTSAVTTTEIQKIKGSQKAGITKECYLGLSGHPLFPIKEKGTY